MTDGQFRFTLLYSGIVAVLGIVFAVRGFKSKNKTPLKKGLIAVSSLMGLSGVFFLVIMIFVSISPAANSKRFFNLDPRVKAALATAAIESGLPSNPSVLKEPWALVTVELDMDGRIRSTNYVACSLGNFSGKEDVKKLRMIVFANACKYDTVSYAEKVNGRSTGKTIKVDRDAGTLFFYDMAEKRFMARYDIGPSSMVSSYDGVGKPSGSMSYEDFRQEVLSLGSDQNPDLYSTYIKTTEEEVSP